MRIRRLAGVSAALFLLLGSSGCIPGLSPLTTTTSPVLTTIAFLHFVELVGTDPNNCSPDEYDSEFEVEFTPEDPDQRASTGRLGHLTLRQNVAQVVAGYLLLDYSFRLLGSGTHGSSSYQESYSGTLDADGRLRGSYSFTQEGCGTLEFEFEGEMRPPLAMTS